MNVKRLAGFLDEYIELFKRTYYDPQDVSARITFGNILSNKINNYIDFVNFDLIEKYLSAQYLDGTIRILDLGCGALDKAFILRKLYPRAEIHGVEAAVSDDPGHVEVNKTRFNKSVFFETLKKDHAIDFSLYDGRNLSFSDNWFDVILLYATIEHVRPEDRTVYIQSVQKKLKTGGIFIIARCPQKYGLFEMISERFTGGAHQWRLVDSDFKKIFPAEQFEIVIKKKLNNIFTRPTAIVNRLYRLLVVVNQALRWCRWPLFAEYFLIVKKRPH